MKKVMRYHWLAKIINERKYTNIVEVGVATGVTTKYLLDNCPDIMWYTAIDSWTEEHRSQWYTPKNSNTEENFRKKLAKYDYIRPLHVLKGISWELARHFKDGKIDLVFIDASHDYESVCKDIDAWLPKVRKGGILCGHDINYVGVLQAVKESLPYFTYAHADNCWLHAK